MRPPLRQTFRTALLCRCPHCQHGRVFARWPNTVLPQCSQCGLAYFREPGYYVGGMVITYGLTVLLLLAVYLFSLLLPDVTALSRETKQALWIVFAFLVGLALVRHSYSLWLSLDYWIEPWQPRATHASGLPSSR